MPSRRANWDRGGRLRCFNNPSGNNLSYPIIAVIQFETLTIPFWSATKERRPTARRGAAAIAVAVFSEAGPGSAFQATSARRPASGSPPTSGTAVSAFGSGGRFLHLEFLFLCVLGVGGAAPNFFVRKPWRTMSSAPALPSKPIIDLAVAGSRG